jgi:hypothetical protein
MSTENSSVPPHLEQRIKGGSIRFLIPLLAKSSGRGRATTLRRLLGCEGRHNGLEQGDNMGDAARRVGRG